MYSEVLELRTHDPAGRDDAAPWNRQVPGPQPDNIPLAVDLDGTLVRTDLLYETFWSAMSRAPAAALAALPLLARDRAAFKDALARQALVDPSALPYDDEVLAFLRAERARGRRILLVTASDRKVARSVSEHLGLFDEVHASDGARNLKGYAKAALLTEMFGAGGFDYVGDAHADLPVWRKSRRAITVGASERLRHEVDALPVEHHHIASARRRPADYLRAMRPHQWLKNILVFAPAAAAHDLSAPVLLASLLAFVAFSLIASGVYLINDLLDLAADRAHPRKRFRPLAAGAVPILHGSLMAPALIVLGFAAALATGEPALAGILLGYIALTTAYSVTLKRQMVIDVCALAGLYTMRILAGGFAAGVPLSEWLLAFSVFIFLSLAAVKRQAELTDGLARGRTTLSGRAYRTDDLPIVAMMAIGAGYVAVLVVGLYVDAADVQKLYPTPEALWGICPVLLYWISRMVMITHRGGMHDDPIVFSVRDRVSQGCCLVMATLVVGAAL